MLTIVIPPTAEQGSGYHASIRQGGRLGLEIVRQEYPPNHEHETKCNAETIDNAERGGAVRVNAE